MATAVRKLDLRVGELVEIKGRLYEVVDSRDGDGLTLEPPITPMARLDGARGAEPASAEEFERLFGHLPNDDEG